MTRLIALMLAVSYVMIAGCNTIQGAGKDIERAAAPEGIAGAQDLLRALRSKIE
jgi:predicted small secreted protein